MTLLCRLSFKENTVQNMLNFVIVRKKYLPYIGVNTVNFHQFSQAVMVVQLKTIVLEIYIASIVTFSKGSGCNLLILCAHV
jgi:hypothetical protein